MTPITATRTSALKSQIKHRAGVTTKGPIWTLFVPCFMPKSLVKVAMDAVDVTSGPGNLPNEILSLFGIR
jgi:hypothetical protein